MDVGVQALAAHLEETWDALLKAVSGADDAALYWTPGPEFNSVAILLRHLAGSERWWIGEQIGGVPAHRNRGAEFLHDNPPRATARRPYPRRPSGCPRRSSRASTGRCCTTSSTSGITAARSCCCATSAARWL